VDSVNFPNKDKKENLKERIMIIINN